MKNIEIVILPKPLSSGVYYYFDSIPTRDDLIIEVTYSEIDPNKKKKIIAALEQLPLGTLPFINKKLSVDFSCDIVMFDWTHVI